jgi:hypothetical protein
MGCLLGRLSLWIVSAQPGTYTGRHCRLTVLHDGEKLCKPGKLAERDQLSSLRNIGSCDASFTRRFIKVSKINGVDISCGDCRDYSPQKCDE